LDNLFSSNMYVLKRQVLALTGVFRLYDANDTLTLYCKQKMFSLREDIRLYNNEQMQEELLHIQARNLIDFSAAYDVFDSHLGTKIGTLRRKGVNSIIRDQWEVLDASEQTIGTLIEDSTALALARRMLLGALLPQNYDLLVNETRYVDIRQRFNLFRYELEIDFRENIGDKVDRRLGIAAGILLAAIEGRQN